MEPEGSLPHSQASALLKLYKMQIQVANFSSGVWLDFKLLWQAWLWALCLAVYLCPYK